MILDLKKVFANTHLHLIIWNRLNEDLHHEGLLLVREFLNHPEFNGYVLPMLRPLGRKPGGYEPYNDPSHETIGNVGKETKDFLLLPGGYSSHCELWLQVANDCEAKAWEKLKDWIKKNNHGKIWRFLKNPEWQPLGNSLEDCPYASTRNGNGTKILCSIKQEAIPWFLKLIWYRASIVMSERLIKDDGIKLINPKKEIDLLTDLLKEFFLDIRLKDYGISEPDVVIDPTLFGVSHMTAFAINSVTKIECHTTYRIEEYFGNNPCLTRPHLFQDRECYLDMIRGSKESGFMPDDVVRPG